jgi:hypothetical protein
MVQEVSQVSFQPYRYNDVLTASIGTPEYLRRVRGFGSANMNVVYKKGSKGKTSHNACISKSELQDALGQQRTELTSQFNDLFQRKVRQILVVLLYISPSTEEVLLPTQGSSNYIHLLQTIKNNVLILFSINLNF